MREIVLDTETTGLEPGSGDRIVEIGAVELYNHVPSGLTFHEYLNPERSMPPEAFQVHGLGDDFLRGKPKFAAVAQTFLDFVGEAPLVIHNAAFDMKFLNAELGWLGLKSLPMTQAIDTLSLAKKKFPGAPASLDALCRRFGLDNSSRALHGALLDSHILAKVYLELIGGRQPGLVLAQPTEMPAKLHHEPEGQRVARRRSALPDRTTDEERSAHASLMIEMGQNALWNTGG